MARGDIRQRISLEGGEEVRRQLQQLGQSGERAAQQIGGAMAAQGSSFAALDRSMLGTFATLGKAGAAVVPAKAAFTDLHAHAGKFGNALTNIGTVLVPAFASSLKLGLAGAAAGAAFGFGKIISGATNSILEMRNLSIQSGLSIKAIQGIKDVFEDAGVPVENLSAFVGRFSEGLGKAREEAQKAAAALGDTQSEVSALRGAAKDVTGVFVDEVNVMRGGTKVVRDTSDAFKSLGINVRAFPDTMAGNQAALIEFSRRLGNVKDGTEQARIGAQLFGRTWRAEAAGILKLAPQLEGAIRDRALKGLTISPEEQQRALDYRKAVNDLGDQWERVGQQIGSSVFPMLTAIGQKTEESVQNMRVTAGAFGELITALWEKVRRDHGATIDAIALKVQESIPILQGFWSGYIQWQIDIHKGLFAALTQGWTDFTTVFKSIWDSATVAFSASIDTMLGWLRSLIDTANAAAAAVARAFGGGGGAPAATAPIPPPGNFARGGLIRGPGTGTSDSIPAWLSNYEFVNTARAVRYWGPELFADLNRLQMPKFAMGGLVDAMNTSLLPRSRGFKAGGLVAAGASSGGAPVHLHLDGRSFALRGEQNVVEALGKHARSRRVRSGGRAPSWVG